MSSASKLQKLLEKGEFVLTGECGPPRGVNPDIVKEKGNLLKDVVDAVNVTDNQTSVVRMSSIASAIILKQIGLEPIMQMVTRDRNRIAIQSDIIGAAAHGINTMLCLSGDHQQFGDNPQGKNVYDLDSVQLIQTVKMLKDEGKFLNGDELDGSLDMFIGAAANPFADPFETRVPRLAKKAKAGVQFIQTQCIYNLDKFEQWMEGVVKRNLHKEVAILAGVTPMKSVGMAKYMKNRVPGMDVPDEVIERLSSVDKEKQADEGIQICIESMDKLKKMEGVKGIHLMAIEWEEKVPEIVEKAGLLPRPKV